MAMIFGDTRENNGANPYLSAATAENNKNNATLSKNQGGGNIQFEIKRLTVGDYCILIKKRDIQVSSAETHCFVAMVIERKTWKDLSASIKDERVIHQTKNLLDVQKKKGCLILYLIEGGLTYRDDYHINNIAFKQLHAKLRHNLIRGIPFIQTKDEQHTAKTIVDLARDIMKLYHQGEFELGKVENIPAPIVTNVNNAQNENEILTEYCEMIQNINNQYKEKFLSLNKKPNIINEIDRLISNAKPDDIITYSDDLVDDFDLPDELKIQRPLEDSDIILNMWASLPGMSAKSAILVMNNFYLYEILAAISTDIKRLKQKILDLKFPSGKRLGVRLNIILDLAYQGDDPIKVENLKELSIKMLSCVPGVSENSAKIILQNWSLRDICNGFVQADMLTELKKNNRRIISQKVAEKIIQILKKPDT